MFWVGLDLPKRYVTACALDGDGTEVAAHRRLPPDAEALITWFQGLVAPVTVARKATLYWAWLHYQLSAVGIPAVALVQVHPSSRA
jgi:transposase